MKLNFLNARIQKVRLAVILSDAAILWIVMPCRWRHLLGHFRGRNFRGFVRKVGREEDDVKNGVFWDVTPRGSCKNGRFGGT
jgi:hypothetical protein